MNYTKEIKRIKEINSLYVEIIDFLCNKLLYDESIKSDIISTSSSMVFRFSSENKVSFDICFDYIDTRISFFIFECNNINESKFYEVTDSYFNKEVEAKELFTFLIELLSNPIKIYSIKNIKGDVIFKKIIEYTSLVDRKRQTTKGYLVNKFIFPWQKTKMEKKEFDPWIENN